MNEVDSTKGRFWLFVILILSVILNFTNLSIQRYSNEYYAAGVKSMLTSFKNFFFVSFDPAGFVSINKPPVGLWIQAISAKIFGFNGLSIVFPQALCGVISVWILYILVKRYFGIIAGLVSSLCLATTPIFVATSRNNTMDNQLVMVLLIASYFLFKAIEKGKLKHLVWTLIFVGIGFNIKMLQAYFILPAIYLTYLISCKIKLKEKISNLAICTVVLVGVSLFWSIVVDLVPVSQRPYVGSSLNNSEIELIVDYNGIERLNNIVESEISYGSKMESNNYGIMRLFSKGDLVDQISWLFPFSLIGFLVAVFKEKVYRTSNDGKGFSIIFWMIYLLSQVFYFSYTKGVFHPYYLTMMTTPIAAFVGIGVKCMLDLYKEYRWHRFILPIALIINGAVEVLILSYYVNTSTVSKLLTIIVVTLVLISSVGLIINKTKHKSYKDMNKDYKLIKGLMCLGFLGLLITPIIWAGTTLIFKMPGSTPAAGLELTDGKNGVYKMSIDDIERENTSKLITFLKANKNKEKYILSTLTATGYASKIIIDTDESVMAIGGFLGTDKIIALGELKEKAKSGDIRYIMIPNIIGTKESIKDSNYEILNWVRNNGNLVDKSNWVVDTVNSDNNKSIGKDYNSTLKNNRNTFLDLYDLKGIEIY